MPVEFLTDVQAGAYGGFAGLPSRMQLERFFFLDHAIQQLRATGYPVLDADVARLSPYMRRHINFHGHYSFAPADLGGARRALRDPTHPTTTEQRQRSASPQGKPIPCEVETEPGPVPCAVAMHGRQ